MAKYYKYIVLGMILIGVVALLFMLSDCGKDPIINKHNEEKKEFHKKIDYYEKSIVKDSIIIFNSNRSYRDSIRAEAYRQYMQRDTLH